VDWVNGGVYEFPAGGGAAITLVAVGGLGGNYQNPGIVIDPNNNLYLEANYNNALVMFPWNAATGTWTGLSSMTPANPSTAICTNNGKNNEANCWAQYGISGYSQGYFQPWGIAVGINNTLLIGNQSSGNYIMSLGVNNAWTNPTVGSVTVEQLSAMTKRPISVAQDPEGNVYFVEDSGGLSGLYRIPSGASLLSGDNDPSITRVDPNLPSVSGVITDAAGNLYISDSKAGVFLVANPSGTPQTNAAVMLSPVPAQGEVAIDWARNVMYVPTTLAQNNGQADVAMVRFGFAELGSSPVGTAAATVGTVGFGFNGSASPAKFVIVEDGVQQPDFSITGGTCTTGSAYSAGSGCLENVTLNPTSVGSLSARLLMLDKNNNILASMVLHGTGTGANVQVAPPVQSTAGGGLKTPDQIAVDASGNVYVADSGLDKVLQIAPGSGASAKPVSLGAGLTSPTGVAVDGAGDVFIADSGAGSVYEIPFGANGLNAAGQATLVSGLGTGLNLAADGQDNLYIADPANKRVVKLSNVSAATASSFGQTEASLTTGLTAPSAVAVDSNNNLYVIDGANLFEFAAGGGAPTTLLNNLSGATGLEIDPSGAVYISSAGGTTRVPYLSGALLPAAESSVASGVSDTSSVALDRWGNIYLAPASGGNLILVTTNGMLTMPSPSTLTASTTAIATITNAGNSALTVTGYTSSNSVDFLAADSSTGGCEAGSPLAAGATCTATITFDPGAGEQGTLSSTIGVSSNAINAPITISATGQGLALGASVAGLTVASAAEVVNTPLTVTVASKSGSGKAPSGQVTVSFTSWTVQTVSSNTPQAIVPVTATVTGNLDSTGKAQFNLAPVMAGAQTFSVAYSGDRTYSRSTQTVTATVGKSQIASIALPKLPDPTDVNLPFVVPNNGTGSVPYDSSETPWQYSLSVKVNTAFGIPTGTITMMDDSSTCPPGTSATGVGAATCALTSYKGVACPQNAAAGNLVIQNSNSPNASSTSFGTSCLYQVPSGTTYTPVVYTHYVTPAYSGDANFMAASGAPRLFQATRGPLVQITTSAASSATTAPSLTVPAGSSASIGLNLTSILGYGIAGKNGLSNNATFPVTLNCDNLPPHASCSFNYPNPDKNISNAVDIPWPSNCTTQEVAEGLADSSGDLCVPSLTPVSTSSGTMTTGTGQVVMTIYTNVTTGTTTSRNASLSAVTLAAVFSFGMIGLFFRRREFEKRRRMSMLFLSAIALLLAISMNACSTTNLSPEAVLSSPAGTYAVSITSQQVGDQCEPSGALGSNCTTSSGGPGQLSHGTDNPVSLPFYINVTVQ
jgi:hypothetical protein